MTREEFSRTLFMSNSKVTYKGKEYPLISVNFDEDLVGLDMWGDGDIYWVRCESIGYNR